MITNLVNSSKKILIVTKQEIDLDLLWASKTLAQIIKKDKHKVRILVTEDVYNPAVSNIINIPSELIQNTEINKDYKITLQSGDVDIENVSWQQHDSELNIVIKTKNGEIDSNNLKVDEIGFDYDLIILLGEIDIEKIEFLNKNKALVDSEKIIHITHSPSKYKNVFTNTSSSTFCELIFGFLKNNFFALDKSAKENLISGIYWKTNSLKIIESDEVFDVLKELRENSDYKFAVLRANKTLQIIDLRLISSIINNLRVNKDKVGTSIVNMSTLNNLKIKEVMFKMWNLLDFVSSIQTSIVILVENNVSNVFITSLSENKHLEEIKNKYDGEGDLYNVEFRSSLDPNILSSELELKLSIGQIDQEELSRLNRNLKGDIELKEKSELDSNSLVSKSEETAPQLLTEEPSEEKIVEEAPIIAQSNVNESNEVESIIQEGKLEEPIEMIEDHDDEDEEKLEVEEDSYINSFMPQIPSGLDPLAPATSSPQPLQIPKDIK